MKCCELADSKFKTVTKEARIVAESENREMGFAFLFSHPRPM